MREGVEPQVEGRGGWIMMDSYLEELPSVFK